jgi:predicted phage terminase large subunit-like protein
MHDLVTPLRRPVTERMLFDSVLRSDLNSFIQKAFTTVSPGDGFSANWHIEAMAHELTMMMRGENRRLIITIPPRHLKSICTSVAFPAFLLGHDPTRRIICVSYSQELAVKHANDCRTIMNSDWYRRLFPGTKVDPSKNTETEVMTTERGFRLSTSVGGTLTGRGGNLIVIDDPIKPADAMSDTTRERLLHWYRTTLLSRLDDKVRDSIILVMQRLHVGDLAGHLLEQGGWKHLNLPAIAEIEQRVEIGPGTFHTRKVGDLLHPARESKAVLDDMKVAMGSATFSAQYQQSPIPAGGHMVDWNWFRWYDPNELTVDDVVISWDTAMKPTELSDYSVGTVWGTKGDFYYLIDLVRVRLDYPSLRRKIIEVYDRWHKPTVLIEDAGSGTSLIQDLCQQNIPVVAIRPRDEKIIRMSAQTAKIEAGAVHLPRHALWLDDLRSEMLAFPNGIHDDQVDSISQALNWMSQPRRRLLFTRFSDVADDGGALHTRGPGSRCPIPNTAGCEEYLKTDGRWVQLPLCLTCGHVRGCDSSPGKHATARSP